MFETQAISRKAFGIHNAPNAPLSTDKIVAGALKIARAHLNGQRCGDFDLHKWGRGDEVLMRKIVAGLSEDEQAKLGLSELDAIDPVEFGEVSDFLLA